MGLDLLILVLIGLVVFVWDKAISPSPAGRARRKATKPAAGTESAYCVRAIDGDTIEVVLDGNVERVRYIGMDTPEIGEPGYESAKAENRKLVEGKMVTLESDKVGRDPHGRLLRYVYVGRLFVNAELVRRGKAKMMVVKPNVSRIAQIADGGD